MMEKLWRVFSAIALAMLVLGALVFGLSLLMGADLTRVAATVDSSYDLAAIFKFLMGIGESIKSAATMFSTIA